MPQPTDMGARIDAEVAAAGNAPITSAVIDKIVNGAQQFLELADSNPGLAAQTIHRQRIELIRVQGELLKARLDTEASDYWRALWHRKALELYRQRNGLKASNTQANDLLTQIAGALAIIANIPAHEPQTVRAAQTFLADFAQTWEDGALEPKP